MLRALAQVYEVLYMASQLNAVHEFKLNPSALTCDDYISTSKRCEVLRGTCVLRNYAQPLVVAIKRLSEISIRDVRVMNAFAEEIRLVASVQHQNIVHLVGFVWEPSRSVDVSSLAMVMEYMVYGRI